MGGDFTIRGISLGLVFLVQTMRHAKLPTEQHAARSRAERSRDAGEHFVSQLHNHQLLLEPVPEKTVFLLSLPELCAPRAPGCWERSPTMWTGRGPGPHRGRERPGPRLLNKASGISRNKNEELPKQGLPKIMECFQCLH